MRIYVTHRFVRWRRARDRNPGARRNRALQLTAGSDINTQSRRTGHRHRRILPPNRHNTPETYIDFPAHSCIWRETIPGDNIVWAEPRETEGNVLVGARVRPLPHLAQLLALFGALIPVHGSIVAIFKITSKELLLRQSFFGLTVWLLHAWPFPGYPNISDSLFIPAAVHLPAQRLNNLL